MTDTRRKRCGMLQSNFFNNYYIMMNPVRGAMLCARGFLTIPAGTLSAGSRPPPSWRRQGEAPPAGRKSPLIKAISKFGVRAQRTALLRIMHASPFVAANFAFRTLRKHKVQYCAVAVLAAPR